MFCFHHSTHSVCLSGLLAVKALESFEVNLLANTFERPSGAATAVNSSGEEKGHRIWEDQVDV